MIVRADALSIVVTGGIEHRIRRRDGVDLTQVALALEEGHLAARLDEPMRVPDIAVMMGWEVSRTNDTVQRLIAEGILVRAEDAGLGSLGSLELPRPLMSADCELTADERKLIIIKYGELDELTHYEVLEASRGDDTANINRRFQQQCLRWHPDKWRRDLGPFKRMIDEIFQRLQVARKVLMDPKTRADYDRKTAHLIADEAEKQAQADQERRRTRDLVRNKEAQQRRRRRNPVLKLLGRARDAAAEADVLQNKGDMVAALRAAQTALTYDPQNETYRDLVSSLTEKAAVTRAEMPLRRGKTAESLARWEVAISHFEEAVRVAPNLAEPQKRLAYSMIMAGREPRQALPYATRAAERSPEDPEAHFVLGLCYDKSKLKKAAMRAFKTAVKLKPNYREASKRLWNLRLGF